MNELFLDIETGPTPDAELLRTAGNPSNADLNQLRREACLDPLLGRVVAIGIRIDGANHLMFHDSEMELLLELRNFLMHSDYDLLIGHNIIGFDLPYLQARAWKYGWDLGFCQWDSENVVFGSRFIDTYLLWCQGRHRAHGSLGKLARHFGLEDKEDGAGAFFWQKPRGEQEKYLAHDLWLTQKIYQRLSV